MADMLVNIPEPVLQWIDSNRFYVPDELKPETVAALPGWVEAAAADLVPASKRELKKMLAVFRVSLPPPYGLDTEKAIPIYLEMLCDLPAKALPPATEDLLKSLMHYPTIAHIRQAAAPHVGRLYRRHYRLQQLALSARIHAAPPRKPLQRITTTQARRPRRMLPPARIGYGPP